MVLAGNTKLMARDNLHIQEAESPGSVVYLSVDGKYAGSITISDELKQDSADTVKGLKELGIRKIVMLTGDSKAAGMAASNALALDEFYSELLPHQKVELLESFDNRKAAGKKLVFVGDGINDAPVLARADIGVAMGGLGSDAAIEAADVVLMTDEPSKLITAVKIARKTKSIIWQNIFFALGIKAVVLLMGAVGLATMWEAVFADVGVAVIAILNAMRARNI
jgi:Cd2+/Zn2+-exporting ATPase